MKLQVLTPKLYFGIFLLITFLISCHYSFSTELKETLTKLEIAESIEGIVYKVQVGAFSTSVEKEPFAMEQHNDKYVLTYGEFLNYREVLIVRDSLLAAGYKDAWVPIYINGKRSDLHEVSKYLTSLENDLKPELSAVLATSTLKELDYYAKPDSFLKEHFFLRGGKPFYSFVLYGIIFFFGLTLALVGTMVLHRYSVKKRTEKRKHTQQNIRRFFSGLILEDDITDQILNQKLLSFKTSIPYRQDWCKELLINNLIDLNKTFKGEMATMFKDIYLKLDLLSYSEHLIKNGIWYQKTKGIFHFEELGYSEGLPLINPYITHPNKSLRSVALIAHIALEENDPLSIFNNYTGHINKIDELKILDTIKKKKLKIPPYINDWLLSENTSLVLLTIKLIAYYNHLESGQVLLNMLAYENAEIRQNIIIAIRQLLLVQAEDMLIRIFNEEKVDNQLEIIKTLGVIGSEQSSEFLGSLLDETSIREIKIETMKALKEMDSWLYQSSFEYNGDLRLVKLHVEDPYIS